MGIYTAKQHACGVIFLGFVASSASGQSLPANMQGDRLWFLAPFEKTYLDAEVKQSAGIILEKDNVITILEDRGNALFIAIEETLAGATFAKRSNFATRRLHNIRVPKFYDDEALNTLSTGTTLQVGTLISILEQRQPQPSDKLKGKSIFKASLSGTGYTANKIIYLDSQEMIDVDQNLRVGLRVGTTLKALVSADTSGNQVVSVQPEDGPSVQRSTYYLKKEELRDAYWSQYGWSHGALVVPFKIRTKDHSLSNQAASIGYYLGRRVGERGSAQTLALSFGVSQIQTTPASTSSGSQQPASETGYTAAGAWIFELRDSMQLAIVVGQDRIGGATATQKWNYEGGWWWAVAFAVKAGN